MDVGPPGIDGRFAVVHPVGWSRSFIKFTPGLMSVTLLATATAAQALEFKSPTGAALAETQKAGQPVALHGDPERARPRGDSAVDPSRTARKSGL